MGVMVTLTKIGAFAAALSLFSGCIIKDPPKPAAQPECPCACPAEAKPEAKPSAESEGSAKDPADPAPLSEEPASV